MLSLGRGVLGASNVFQFPFATLSVSDLCSVVLFGWLNYGGLVVYIREIWLFILGRFGCLN